jgi:hypothetical protein
MSRFSMVLAAAVATAMIVIAISTLDAVGAGKPKAAVDLTQRLAACIRDRGVAVPALGSTAIDEWLSTHDVPEAIGRACKMKVAGGPDEVRAADAHGVETLLTCLRAQGFDPPSDPMGLKRWIGEHGQAAALKECGVAPAPSCGEKKPEAAGGEPKAAGSEGLAEDQ